MKVQLRQIFSTSGPHRARHPGIGTGQVGCRYRGPFDFGKRRVTQSKLGVQSSLGSHFDVE